MARHGCPSISVAVARRGELVLTAAHGLADVATGRRATPDTPYAIASVTKPMTATAVCLAADCGLLDLDAPVPYAGSWPPLGPWRPPTVRELLQHRGGLAPHYDFRYDPAEPPLDVSFHERPYREPGTAFRYANLGYRRLGLLLEAATGTSLADFLAAEVFAPLGMTRSHLGPTYPGTSATRYTVDGRAYPRFTDTSHPGATLGWATAPELALFAASYQRLLAPGTAAATVDALPVNDHLGYGLGWCVSRGGGPVVRSHGGGMGGVAALVVAVPELELSVAVLSNTTGKAARDEIVDHVLRALVPGWTAALIDPSVPSTLGEEGTLRLPGGRLLALDLVAGLAVTYKEGDSTGWLGDLLSFPLFLAS
jgi:CubicO group peptidase (beta-lactamase class C family)